MKDKLQKNSFDDEESDLIQKGFVFGGIGVVAVLFFIMGLPMTIMIFLALVGYFIWRLATRTDFHQIRGVFEFYLAANEILRDDERRWFGFEINEIIERGEAILRMMPDAPPLVYFTLGALHHRAGNYKDAQENLAYLVENEKSDEKFRMTASPELRSYIRILRKIEREPAEAPQTMAAIRALERSRRNRAATLLMESRKKVEALIEAQKAAQLVEKSKERNETAVQKTNQTKPVMIYKSPIDTEEHPVPAANNTQKTEIPAELAQIIEEAKKEDEAAKKRKARNGKTTRDSRQKTITEVLRDIYDKAE